MRAAIIATGLAGLAIAGCAIDGTEDPPNGAPNGTEATSEAHQEVAGAGIWAYGCDNTNCGTGLTPQDGWVCFLGGIYGSLQGASSQVQVFTSGGSWGLQVSSHHPLGGVAVCVTGTVVATGTWHSGGPPTVLATARGIGAPRCFLSGVITTNGFTSANHFVQIHTVGNNSVLDGDTGGDTTAFAVCLNTPTAQAAAPLTVGDGGGLVTVGILDNSAGGFACGLKKLGGHFNTNDYSDGAWLDYASPWWRANAVNGKTIVAGCVK